MATLGLNKTPITCPSIASLRFWPRYFIKGWAETTGFYPTNQNTLYLLHLFDSDNKIITVHGRPAICTLIGWIGNGK